MPLDHAAFRRQMQEYGITADHKLLLACSGGRDSAALFHLLEACGYSFETAHCNFGLRGEESEADEMFVRELCSSKGVRFHSRRFDAAAYARDHGISIQMAARDLRYEWFDLLLAGHKLNYLVTAHHLDDLVETQLLNILRGTGLKGLIGIQALNGNKLRPLLVFARREIDDYVDSHKIQYREDSSNRENKYQRNLIRNEVIPILEKINPSVREHLELLSHLSKEAIQMVETSVKEIKKSFEKRPDGTLALRKEMIPLHQPNLHLYELLSEFGLQSFSLKVAGQLYGEPGKVFHGEVYSILIDRDELIIRPNHEEESSSQELNPGDSFECGGIRYGMTLCNEWTIIPDERIALLDADKLELPLTLRPWKKGDSFRPLGMRGNKLVSDFLVDSKVDRFSKDRVRLLCSGDRIACIVGRRISEDFKITNSTLRVLMIAPVP